MHRNVQLFQAKNHRLLMADWRHLFVNYFGGLRVLNLSLSCSDDLLQLVGQNCPLLEKLNATCKFEKLNTHSGNALALTMAVSDRGIAHLIGCQRLRILTLNEARSSRRGMKSAITHDGLRQLLRDVPSMEEIVYSDLGAIIAKCMGDVPKLHLKALRHFNATPETLAEIFRLCRHLESLNLVFFTSEDRAMVMQTILEQCPRQLRCLELTNLRLAGNLTSMLRTLGGNLTYLVLTNKDEKFGFDDLETISLLCPKLRYFSLMLMSNAHDPVGYRPPNRGQFAELRTLYLYGIKLNVEQVLMYCTENAVHLESVSVSESEMLSADTSGHLCWIEDQFLERIKLHDIVSLELLTRMEFSLNAVRKLIRCYDRLKHLRLYCTDDCSEMLRELQISSNYSFYMVNQRDIYSNRS